MCARFSLVTPLTELASYFEAGLDVEIDIPARANVAPTLEVPVIVGKSGDRHIKVLRWGLVPSWATTASAGAKFINARSETAREKPAFREAFRRRRCIIPADGFYEWREESDEVTLDLGLDPSPNGKTKKQPYHFRQKDGHPMSLAGLWERSQDANDRILESFTILTTEPNKTLQEFHDRMPCILHRADIDIWLQEDVPLEALMPFLQSFPDDQIEVEKADPRINNVRFEPLLC